MPEIYHIDNQIDLDLDKLNKDLATFIASQSFKRHYTLLLIPHDPGEPLFASVDGKTFKRPEPYFVKDLLKVSLKRR